MKKDEEGYLQIKNRLDWYHLQKQDKLYHRNDTEICAPNNEGGGTTWQDPNGSHDMQTQSWSERGESTGQTK